MGIQVSASMGVRDNNELSWTQVLEIVEFMSDAVKIPILLDGDTGYGNYNNMRAWSGSLNSGRLQASVSKTNFSPRQIVSSAKDNPV